MQETRNDYTSSEGVIKVYPPGFKRLGKSLFAVPQDCIGDVTHKNGNNYTISPMSHKIDLPACDSEARNAQTLCPTSSASLFSFDGKTESYNTWKFQSRTSNYLIFHNEYQKTKHVSKDIQNSMVQSQSELSRDELQNNVSYKSGPQRLRYISKDAVGREDKCAPHAEENYTDRRAACMQKKIKNNGRKEQPPSTKTLRRPQHEVVGFLEDYAEFGSDWLEMVEGGGMHCPTVLESTVDGSIVKGARRSYGSRNNISRDQAIQTISTHKDTLISLDKCGLKTVQHKYRCSVCEVTSRSRQDVEKHIAVMGASHSEAVVLVLLGSQARGQSCPICNIRLTRLQLFKHIRSAHGDCFPLRCGYCVFLGQDYYQLRHHIRKKHGTTRYHIIDVSRLLAEEGVTGDESEGRGFLCPLCRKSLKTLSNLKKHIAQHSRQKQQCNLCSFVTTFPTQIRSHYRRKHPSQTPRWKTILLQEGGSSSLVEDVTPFLKLITEKYGILQPKNKGKWMRQYRCPHCEYTCNFNSSYNRHLRLHSGVKPYKCGYCDFHAREAYVIKKHCSSAHKGNKPIIEDDKNFKAPYRYGTKLRTEKDESCVCVNSEQVVVNRKNKQKSTLLVSQRARCAAAAPPQSSRNSLKTHQVYHVQESQNVKSLSQNESNCSNQNLRMLYKQYQTQDIEATSEPQLNLNLAPSHINMSLDKGKSTTERLQFKTTSDSYVTKPVTHLHMKNTPQEAGLQGINKLGVASKNDSMSLLSSVHYSAKDVQCLRNSFLVNEPKAVVPVHSPVKVKTIKKNDMPDKVKSFMYALDKKQCSKTINDLHNELQRDETSSVLTQVSSSNRQEESLCSITLQKPSVSAVEGRTAVVCLIENVSGNLSIDKITYSNLSDAELSGVTYSEAVTDQDADPQIRKQDCLGKKSEVAVKDTSTGSDIQVSKGNWLKQIGDSLGHNYPKTVPNRGMESNLQSHIAFLSDLHAHRLSNCTPATPEIPTHNQLDANYTNKDYFSTEKVRLMMQREGERVRCRECGVTTTYRAFYKHAKKHFNIKPFKCGYCSYRSIEKSKVRVHNTFRHPDRPFVILKLCPESAGVHCNTFSVYEVGCQEKKRIRERMGTSDQTEIKESSRDSTATESSYLTRGTKLRTSKAITEDLESVIPVSHRSSSTSVACAKPAALASSEKQTLFQCPLCFKFLQKHTPSIRRHLYSHYSYKPYKCGYCSYMGIGQSEIRAHHVTHGFNIPPKVETSGVPVPPGLTLHIKNTFPLQYGMQPSIKKKEHTCHQNPTHNDVQMDAESGVWKETSKAIKDINVIHLSSQNDTEEKPIFSSDQKNVEACDAPTYSLPQTIECDSPVSRTAYAVQVLESVENTSSASSRTHLSQLNLSVVCDQASVNSEPVCVVYLFD